MELHITTDAAGTILEPNLHDADLYGIEVRGEVLAPTTVFLRLRLSDRSHVVVTLTDVVALRIDGVHTQNVVLDAFIERGTGVQPEYIERPHTPGTALTGAAREHAQRLCEDIKSGRRLLFGTVPAVGATVLAVATTISIVRAPEGEVA